MRFSFGPTQYRARRLRQFCSFKTGVGLEIGPLANPTIGKSEGVVYYADHLSRDDLQEKYSNDPKVDTSRIVDIDIVLDTDLTVLGAYPRFDYVVASHVFEHLPNAIGWLRGMAGYLNAGATLALAIPDKRFTFDVLREPTRFSELLANDVLGLITPSPTQVLDHFVNVAHVETKEAWSWKFRASESQRKYSVDQAIEAAEHAADEYVDCHCTVWTVESFSRNWARLCDSGMSVEYALHRIFAPVRFGNDFVVILKRK